MLVHLLNYFEIQSYYQNEPTFNGIYWKNNLLEIKDGAYIINLDEYKSTQIHWITLYVNKIVNLPDSFGVQHIAK